MSPLDSLSAIQVLLVGRVGGKVAHFLYLLPSQRNAIISHTLYFTNHSWILSLAFGVGGAVISSYASKLSGCMFSYHECS